jgi:predicted dehydrogenase
LTPLTVLVVGCGNIAGRLDHRPNSATTTYTHAGAYRNDARFKIMACVDPNTDRRDEFMDLWGVPAGYAEVADLFNHGDKFDVVSICTPTQSHAKDIRAAMVLKPRLIFCEKPVTLLLSDTIEIIEECRARGTALAVNYTRRWDPEIQALAQQINDNVWGRLRSISAHYNKGLFNNGSHIIDLLLHLVGPLSINYVSKPTWDFYSDDPTISVCLAGPNDLPVHIMGGHACDYTWFEMQFVFEKMILTMENGGLHWNVRKVEDSDIFNGYRVLTEPVRYGGQYSKAMPRAIENIFCALVRAQPLVSSGDTALETQRLCHKIRSELPLNAV